MNLKQVYIVFRKEIIDIIRDRRTIISMVVVPLFLFPLLIGGMNSIIGGQVNKLKQKSQIIAVVGLENLPELRRVLQESGKFQIIDSINDLESAKLLLEDKTVLVVVNIPADFHEKMTDFFAGKGNTSEIEIFSDQSDFESEIATEEIVSITREFRHNIIKKELIKRGLRDDLLKPFDITTINTASQENMGGFLAGIIMPYMIILLSMIGAMYPAIDLTAGEKERGTLETLLVSPVGRMEIVMGKFLVVMSASLTTSILVIISLYISISSGFIGLSSSQVGIKLVLGLTEIVGLLVLMIPLSMLFSAILLTLAIFARSYKEAQSYISPLMILVILPAMVSYIPGIKMNTKLAITPIVNTALMMKDTLEGNSNLPMTALTVFSTIIYAAIAIYISLKMFNKESVLFRL